MKYNIEDAKKIFKNKGLYILNPKEFKNSETKLICKDNEGYLYFTSVSHVKNKKCENYNHKFSTKNPYAINNLNYYIKKNVTNGTELISNTMVLDSEKLIFKCGLCNKEYNQQLKNFIRSSHYCCPTCNLKYFSSGRLTKTEEVFKEIKKLNLIPLYEKFKGTHYMHEYQDKDGYKGIGQLINLRNGSSINIFNMKNPYVIDNLNLYFKKNNIATKALEIINDKKGSKVKCLCECGREFVTYKDIVRSKKFKCNYCTKKESINEIKVKEYLKKINMNFLTEYIFNDCKGDMSYLPFDFYIPSINSCIEVDGEFHYAPINITKDKQKAQREFEKRKRYDKIKTDYCKSNDIALLRIPYWEIKNNNYKKMISNFIKSCCETF